MRKILLKMSTTYVLSALLAGITLASLPASGHGEDTERVELPNRHPRMVHEYFINRLKQIEKEADKKRYAITTRQQAEAYVSEVRAKIDRCFGPWPERTPLYARTVKAFEREGYTVENVIYESRPGFLLSANLYIPKGKKLRHRLCWGCAATATTGKHPDLPVVFAGLALQGYVVLIIDPIGQGERLQYLGEDLKSWVGWPRVRTTCTPETSRCWSASRLPVWRTWDGIRGIDYLVSRGRRSTPPTLASRAVPVAVRSRPGSAPTTAASRWVPTVLFHHHISPELRE